MKLLMYSCMAWRNRLLIALAGVMIIYAGAGAAELQLSLEQAITRALDYDHGLAASRHDSTAANIEYSAARAERLPTLSLDAKSFYISEVEKIETPLFSKEIGTKENYQADFRLSLPLYTGGGLSSGIKIAQAMAAAANENVAVTSLDVAYRARRAYLQLMRTMTLNRAAEASVKRLEIIRDDVQNLFENGVADSIDILETRIALIDVKVKRDEAAAAVQSAKDALARLLGVAPDTELVASEDISGLSGTALTGAQDSAVIARPELDYLDDLIRAADYRITMENASYMPKLSGFVGYSVGKPNRDLFNKSWNDQFLAGVNLNWGINLGGRDLKNAHAAREKAAAARARKNELNDKFEFMKSQAVNDWDRMHKISQRLEEEYNLSSRRYDLARSKQREGQLTVNRLLEMEAELRSTEQRYRAALIETYLALSDFYYATGSQKIFGGLL